MIDKRTTIFAFYAAATLLVCVGIALQVCAETDSTDSVSGRSRTAAQAPPDRSPTAVAVSPDRRFAAVANHTSGSVSLVDLDAGAVLTECECGEGPADVAWLDTGTLLATLLHDDAVVLLTREGTTLTAGSPIPVGDEPRGIALSPNRERAFIALAGSDEVAVFDLQAKKATHRIPVGGQPKTLAVSPDGCWLVTLCNVPGQVFVHDATTLAQVSRRNVFDYGFNLGVPALLPDSSAVIFPCPVNRTFPITPDNIEKGWAIDNRVTRVPLPDGQYWRQQQMNLDIRGAAAGDPSACALDSDANWLVVACAGSHELLILKQKEIPWPSADPGDFLPDKARWDEELFRRVELGGRPIDVEFIDGRRVAIANYFLNSLQIVDIERGEVVRTIDLGGPAEPSLVRRGEMIFHDADRSLAAWFSCHTCHPDGHTCSQTFDTINDGNYDTYKLTPSLRSVTHTGPWTWHGWQKSLADAMRTSMHETLATEDEVNEADVEALLAYLGSLSHPANPHRAADGALSAAAERGGELFAGKAGCIGCHGGEHFTSNATYKVGLESVRDYYPEFNPPSLRGVHSRRRFLHDGRAKSLEEVLTRHHQPENLSGEILSDTERAELIEYLKSL